MVITSSLLTRNNTTTLGVIGFPGVVYSDDDLGVFITAFFDLLVLYYYYYSQCCICEQTVKTLEKIMYVSNYCLLALFKPMLELKVTSSWNSLKQLNIIFNIIYLLGRKLKTEKNGQKESFRVCDYVYDCV
jgi:hypothetical protein